MLRLIQTGSNLLFTAPAFNLGKIILVTELVLSTRACVLRRSSVTKKSQAAQAVTCNLLSQKRVGVVLQAIVEMLYEK